MNILKETKSQIIRDRFQSIILTLSILKKTVQTYDRYQEKVLKIHDLTPSQFVVLYELHQASCSPLFLGDLAEILSITQGTLTGLVKRLEIKKLVQRIPQENDRRKVVLALTPAGKTIVHNLTTIYFTQQSHDLNEMNSAELDLLRVLLHKLEKTFDQALSRCIYSQRRE